MQTAEVEKVERREWLRVREVCELMGLSRGTVDRLIHDGELSAFRAGSAVRVSRESISEYASRNAVAR